MKILLWFSQPYTIVLPRCAFSILVGFQCRSTSSLFGSILSLYPYSCYALHLIYFIVALSRWDLSMYQCGFTFYLSRLVFTCASMQLFCVTHFLETSASLKLANHFNPRRPALPISFWLVTRTRLYQRRDRACALPRHMRCNAAPTVSAEEHLYHLILSAFPLFFSFLLRLLMLRR